MKQPLAVIAPHFVDTAHRIGVSVAATVDLRGRARSRVVQPVWTWDGERLTGWLSTDTTSPKYHHVTTNRTMSLTYWNPAQDTCTADCEVSFVSDPTQRATAWSRFATTPAPAGFDPATHPDWETPESPTFGVLLLTPTWLRVMPGTLMTEGIGEVWTWSATANSAA